LLHPSTVNRQLRQQASPRFWHLSTRLHGYNPGRRSS